MPSQKGKNKNQKVEVKGKNKKVGAKGKNQKVEGKNEDYELYGVFNKKTGVLLVPDGGIQAEYASKFLGYCDILPAIFSATSAMVKDIEEKLKGAPEEYVVKKIKISL